MYEDTDYDALERNVKYIPWKGKTDEWYTWHKTFLVRAMMRGYHGILVGLVRRCCTFSEEPIFN